MKRLFFTYILFFAVVLSTMAQRPKIGLVLGGGGAKGATEVGVLHEIEHAGIPIDYIAGTSIGSIVGGLYSVGYRADDLDTLFRSQDWLALLTDRDTTLSKRIIKEEDGITYLFGFPIRKRKNEGEKTHGFGVLHGDKVYNFLDSLVTNAPLYKQKNRTITPIPFRCVAFDMKQQAQVLLSDDRLARNMRASMAIPGAFKPVVSDSLVLFDGGIINNLPVDVVREMGADIVIAVDLTQTKHDDFSAPLSFLKGLGGIVKWLVERPDIVKYNENRKQADIYINPNLNDYGVTSFSSEAIADMIKIGRRAGQAHYSDFMQLKNKCKK